MKKQIIEFLKNRGPFTCVQLQKIFPHYKLSSLSSMLKKLVDDNSLKRIEKFGPRGGYGYFI